MKKLLLFVILGFALTSNVTAGLSDVSTFVTADRKIAIVYTLTADDPDNTMPVFTVNFSAEIAGKRPFAMKTMEGPGKTGIVIGEGTYTSVWNAAKDRKKEDPNAITVSAEGKDVTDEATYLCLDLKRFKIRYQNDPPDVTKSTCKTKELWLRRIEPGTFMMGSPTNELGRSESDETQHEVTLTNAFYIGIFETTQKQFKTITGYNISQFKGSTRPVDYVSYNMLRGAENGSMWPLNFKVDERCFWSFEIAKHYSLKKHETIYKTVTGEGPTFFHALRSKAGEELLFDLPTETQWEYACRAGTTTAWNNGTDITDTENDPELEKLGCTHWRGAKVGSYQPNAWGLYDMHGNVWERCLFNVLRGGGWHWCDAEDCRSASRRKLYNPYNADDDWGFRVVLVQNVFSGQDNQIQKDFEFDIPSGTEDTLPVFKVELYGKIKDGKEYLLEEIGKLEYDGASGIVLGKGPHKLTWIPDTAYTNIADEIELRVNYEDVTSQATYLVLDLPSNKMRTSTSGPNISNDKCRIEELWLRRIEPGSFTMGSPEDELGRKDNETQHEVTLTKAFYIGAFEMTQKQFKTITGYNFSRFKGSTRPVECVSYNMLRGAENGSMWPLNYEVDEESVLGRIRKKAGNIFDLPTEAQWEYACRAGTTTALNSGKNLTNEDHCPNMDVVGRNWYNGGGDKDDNGEYKAHTKVGSYKPNAWGLYDMHGNVEEWCLDWYGEYAGEEIDPAGASTGSYRVLRGGSWNILTSYCRSAGRHSGNYAQYAIGFRVVLVQ